MPSALSRARLRSRARPGSPPPTAISPQPPTQYDVRLTLDGKAAPIVKNSLAIRVENLDRGAHEAQLELLAKDGTILAKSKPVTFYLHRASINPAPKVTPLNNKG